jgi:beta-glucosidase
MKMNRVNRLGATLLLTLTTWAAAAQSTGTLSTTSDLPFRNVRLSVEQRTQDLLSRLTLQEKADLLRYDSPAIERLGIPAYNWWNECLHGVARAGLATVFPQAIGMAAMFDGEEMHRIAEAISDEARAKYTDFTARNKRGIYQGLTYWTPNINIFRDPRWGRGMETYGEDPFLTGELAVPFIKGLQGNNDKYFKLIATAKHFAVHSGPESLRHSFDVWPSKRDLAETYFPHFEKVVKEAHVYSVMCAYNAVNGAPCCGNKFLEDILRNKWGFKGYIVSDCWAIHDFFDKGAHEVAKTAEEASAMAIKAGTDLNCGTSYLSLVSAVQQGLLTEKELDVSVVRVLTARMKLGMFDPDSKVPYASIPYSVVDSKEHRALALDAARKSMVLLKNEGSVLPLSKNLKSLAVIGPNADDKDVLLANYNGYPSRYETMLSGLREKLPQTQVRFAQGCALATNMPILEPLSAKVLYADSTLQQHGLRAEYFDNKTLEGNPLHRRVDETVDFMWQSKSPFPDMKYDAFSVRWTGYLVVPETADYALGAEGFSGYKYWVDDSLLIKYESEHHSRKEYQYVHLEAGRRYRIRLEYTQNNAEYAHMRLLWDARRTNLLQQAIEVARNSDAVVLCMGLSPLLEGEEMKVKVDGFSGGDRLDIGLPAVQTELIREITKLGKPTVLVLLNGSALAINWEQAHVPAILEAWYPGQAGGSALADILFGDSNPSGRLPLTFYRSIDQIPPFVEYDMTGKTYRYFKDTPLYEFGYGLSYTSFAYSGLTLPSRLKAGSDLKVKATVKNTGTRAGDEIVQVYVTVQGSAFRVPVRSLQGFRRVSLQPGESKVVEFTLHPKQMAAFDDNGVAQIHGGSLCVSVGGKQPDAASLASHKVLEKTVAVSGVWFDPEP